MVENKKLTDEDNALLEELGIEIEQKRSASYTVTQERIMAGFKEIQEFVARNGRFPEHGEGRDIFERLYAVRLDQIRRQEACLDLLKEIDFQNLLSGDYKSTPGILDNMDDDELLSQLGVDDKNSITNLKFVKSKAEKRAAEEVANRTICEDFALFRPLFDEVKKDIDTGYKTTLRFRKDVGFTKTSLKKSQFLIIGGQISYIADIGKTFKAPNGEDDARLRVIYANGTESNILLRSLIRAMYKDETSRFITDPSYGTLFSGESSEDDLNSGTIYVLRSRSKHPLVQENRTIVHKIGVTGGDLKQRLANAKHDPTYLLADVEIVATYRLANINRVRLEKVIHKFFSAANLDIKMNDRFGNLVKAKEWFLVPLSIIDEMVQRIKNGTISDYYYDPASAELRKY